VFSKNFVPRSFEIIGLGENSRKIFDFKGLIRKIFRNKDLACQRALKMALGQLRGAVLGDGHASALPQPVDIIAQMEFARL
jgi:hypothetical protein